MSVTAIPASSEWDYGCWSNWKTVAAYKKNSSGNYIVDPATGNKRIFSFSLDERSGELYNGSGDKDDSRCVVALKCAFLTILNPAYALVNMGWQFGTACVRAVRWAIDLFKGVQTTAQTKGVKEAAAVFFKGFAYQFPVKVFRNLWNIVRVPIYALGMQFAYIYGLFNPYVGRKCAAKIEQKLHCGASWKEDYRMMNTPETEGCLKANLEDIRSAKVFYLAFCFIPKHRIDEDRLVIIPNVSENPDFQTRSYINR